MKIFYFDTTVKADTDTEKLTHILNLNIRLLNMFSGMCEAKNLVFHYGHHNRNIVKYVNFSGNFGFNHKNSKDFVILKLYHAFLLLRNEKW